MASYKNVCFIDTNTTTTLLNASSDGIDSSFAFFAILIAHILIILITIFGNILVIVSYVSDTKIRSKPSNLFLLNLSLADLIVGAVSLSVNCAWWVTDIWPLGETPCKLYIVADCIVVYVSVLMVTGISFDRMVMITNPIKYRSLETSSNLRNIYIGFLVITWTVAAMFYVIITFMWAKMTGIYVIDYKTDCEAEYITNFPFGITLICIEFVIPLLLLVCSNIVIYWNIRERGKTLARNTTLQVTTVTAETRMSSVFDLQTDTEIPTESTVLNPKHSQHQNSTWAMNVSKRNRELRRHRRLAFLLMIFVACFLITWLPYCVTVVIYTLCEDICISALTWEIVNIVLWANSACNPWLYAAMNNRFRKNFLKYFSCLFRPFIRFIHR